MKKPILSLAVVLLLTAGCGKNKLSVPDETQAISAASAAGGGTVVVSAGTYLCGPIKLKNNVGLQIAGGATLKVLTYDTYPGSGGTADVAPFIDLGGLTNVMVSGSGTIDGQGSAWWTAYNNSRASGAVIARLAIIGFSSSNTVEIAGITIINAPNTHIGVGKNSNSITITGVTINSPSNSPNTDGIDTWCPNINITNCNISCGDDKIAMDNNSEYVTITGCTFGTGQGLSIGSYAANIDHITVDNCTFNGTDNGIRMKTNRTRGGTIQFLTYSNLIKLLPSRL
jgi:polygalacturonase